MDLWAFKAIVFLIIHYMRACYQGLQLVLGFGISFRPISMIMLFLVNIFLSFGSGHYPSSGLNLLSCQE